MSTTDATPYLASEDAEYSASFAALQAKLYVKDGRVCALHGGLTYESHYQPIFSLSQGFAVGHEALLRVYDSQGNQIPTAEVFAIAGDMDELIVRDRLARLLHMANYQQRTSSAQWLFLNMHPDVFSNWESPPARAFVRECYKTYPLAGHQVVLEVIEESARYTDGFDAAVRRAHDVGCLLALDDFGAGHSNFDRVWRLRPDIVKLDRSLVMRAAQERQVRRMVMQMVSLLHECGALVLMEGVETAEEAFVALESDADLAQGYFFGRPQAQLIEPSTLSAPLLAAWDGLDERRRSEEQRYRDLIEPVFNAIACTAALLSTGQDLRRAAQPFLALPDAQSCYLINSNGRQVGAHEWAAAAMVDSSRAFEPLRSTEGARCAMRPFFRRAIEAIGRVQVTRPYRPVHGSTRLCVTVSVACVPSGSESANDIHVVCGDLAWNPEIV